MGLFRKFSLVVVCVALGAGTIAAKKDKDADKKGEKPPDKKSDAFKPDKKAPPKDATPVDPNAPGRLSLPLVKDHDSFGLKIPYYDVEGRLQMMFNIGVASKLDDDHVKMNNMQVETYNEEGEPEMTVDLPISMLDLNTRVITSDTKTTIKREDFIITGDTVAFNTITREGKLIGNVHMTIYNVKESALTEPPPNPDLAPAEDLPQ